MSAVNDRVEAIREVEEVSGMEHFSQTTLDLLREKTDGAPLLITGAPGLGFGYSRLLITGARGGTGSRGGLFNHLKRLEQRLYAQRILVNLSYPSCPSAN